MSSLGDRPKMYSQLADWFHLVTSPQDYVTEAAFYRSVLTQSSRIPIATVLELGSGGGNNASHLKAGFDMTLVDLSNEMLDLSRALNPECEHVQGDMRTVRLGRQFDAVFVHDAVDYMTTVDDLRAAFVTAFEHCKPGGAALFAPDCVSETLKPATDHGGHDGEGRSIRYLEWTWDPDPGDSTYVVDYAYVLRDSNGQAWAEHDRHICGVFPRATWLHLLHETGFEPSPHEGIEGESNPEVFVGVRPLPA